MKNRIKSGLLAVALIIMSLTTCISAAKVYEYTFHNMFNTGSVAIDLEQYQVNEQGDKQLSEDRMVSPGEHISYMPSITNLRAEAYVRLRIDIVMDQETDTPVTTDDIFMISNGWVQKGDYFYKTEPMKNGESEIAFQGIIVPDNWVSDLDAEVISSGSKAPAQASDFTVTAHADAIQSANFNPDFSSDAPWGPVITEVAKDEDSNSYSVAKPVVTPNDLIFSRSSGLEANTKDLFRNFQLYMAGDKYEDNLNIKNTASNDIDVYFRTKAKDSDVNKNMRLKIEMDNRILYEGNLISDKYNEYTKLVNIKPEKSVKLNYTVTLPDESKNYYSVLADDVEWSFKVIENKDPKTGDNKMFGIWLLVFAFSAGGSVYIISSYFARKKWCIPKMIKDIFSQLRIYFPGCDF